MNDFKGVRFYHWVIGFGGEYSGIPHIVSVFPSETDLESYASAKHLFFPIAGELKSVDPVEFGEYSK